MAGAAGDSLGYEVEFMSRRSILAQYGEKGVTKLYLDKGCYLEEPIGKALFSDDTQMTLFTANGLLNAYHSGEEPEFAIVRAYLDWFYTQSSRHPNKKKSCWLSDIEGLYERRAPGNTCWNALNTIKLGREPINSSKGCGGIMRVAPIALFGAVENRMSVVEVAQLAGKSAEVTHQHPLGFLPASLLAALIYRLVPLTPGLAHEKIGKIALECADLLYSIYEGEYESSMSLLKQLTESAVFLAYSTTPDDQAIRQLGEGWVGEEAWAISLFCAVRHADSVEEAIIASVNHDGDSDSTGAITGNIMGAIYGYNHLKEINLLAPQEYEFEQMLELSDVILAISDDLSSTAAPVNGSAHDTPEKQRLYKRYIEKKPSLF